MNTIGGLIAFNNFLSTSKDRSVAHAFAESDQTNSDCVEILFIMTTIPSKATTPFAYISDSSYFEEEDEVLFSMHTVFRICDIKPINENQRFFQVDLVFTSENDKDLCILTERIREETFPYSEGWYRLGILLLKMGEFDKAQEVIEFFLNETTNDDNDRAHIFGVLATIKCKQGEYNMTIQFYEMELEIYQKTFPLDDLSLAMSYKNIANVYYKMGKYSKALSYQQKALEIIKQSLSRNRPSFIMDYNNIGSVYAAMDKYTEALPFFERALDIARHSLSLDHPLMQMRREKVELIREHLSV